MSVRNWYSESDSDTTFTSLRRVDGRTPRPSDGKSSIDIGIAIGIEVQVKVRLNKN